MRIKVKPALNKHDWVEWFAWYPIVTQTNELVFCETVFRKKESISNRVIYSLNKG